jgi:diacylglycerol kinase (ATP)
VAGLSDRPTEAPPPPLPHERRPSRAGSFVASLNYAFEGVIHVLRTQRNMRVHFAIAFAVLIAALVVGASRSDLIALVLASTLVLVAEMLNTAVEAAIDVATSSFDPRAKIAKDVSAGAVLVTATAAIAVAYLVFAERLSHPSSVLILRVRESPVHLTVIALFLVVLAVIAIKALTGRGTPVRGGLPSGHTAIAFAGWAAILFVTAPYAHHLLIATIAFLMAAMVAQTRVETGIHNVVEVTYGAVVGVLVTLVIFQLWS